MRYVHRFVQEIIQKEQEGAAHSVTGVKSVSGAVFASRCLGRSLENVRPESLESIASPSVRGKSVTFRTRMDFASTLLACDVPNASDGVAVLALPESGTTTTVVEVGKGVDTLVITANQAGDRASRETLRARGNIARAVVTLLGTQALVMITAAVSIMVTLATLAILVALSTLAILVIIAVFIRLSGSMGRSRGLGGGGTAWGRVAAEGAGAPVPVPRALGRWEGMWWLVRSTAALSSEPRPVEGAFSVGG